MASFVLSFFPLDVLDEIWDLVESVSEGFLTYSWLCRDGRLTSPHFYWADLDYLSGYPVLRAPTLASN